MKKIFGCVWLLTGVVFGSLVNQLILWIRFSPQNETAALRVLVFLCLLSICIWPITVIVLLNRRERNVEK